MFKKFLNWFDWYDMAGIFLVYVLIASLVFLLINRSNIIAVDSCLGIITLAIIILKIGWRVLSWGARASYLLWFFVLAGIGTVPYMAWQCRKTR